MKNYFLRQEVVTRLYLSGQKTKMTEKHWSKEDLKHLDSYLCEYSYIEGYQVTNSDLIVFSSLRGADISSFNHLRRWLKHIQSFENEKLSGKNLSVDDILVNVTTKGIQVGATVCQAYFIRV